MTRKLIKIISPIKIFKYAFILILVSELNAQFKEASITFDDRLLRDDEKSSLFNLKSAMQRFYVDTVWNDEYRDLELKLNVQIIFEGNANTGSSESFLIQSLFSNNKDLHFFDKGSQFSLSQNSSLYYDSVYYDPLSSLLGFYGNIILGAELDTWSSLGGSQHYEKARSIAVRASASNFSRGWEQRLLLINLLTDNVGLRKLRFSMVRHPAGIPAPPLEGQLAPAEDLHNKNPSLVALGKNGGSQRLPFPGTDAASGTEISLRKFGRVTKSPLLEGISTPRVSKTS